MAYRPEDELIYRNLLGGSPAIPPVAFPEENLAYGTGDQVIQPEPISAPQAPVADPVDSAALIQEEPVQEAQIAPESTPREGPLPEGIDKLSVSGGGDSARVSQSRTTPVIVTKSRGKAKAPTQRDVDTAAAGDVNAATRAAQGVADAAVEASEADRALLDQQRIAEEQKARFDQEEAALMAEADARANAEADQRIAGIQEAVEAASSMKVDPSRIWNDHGTANKTRGLVAAFVGGFLQPVLGTNTIQQIIDKNIDRDIDAQKEAIAGAQRNVANLRGLHSLGVQQAETEAGQREQERLMRRASLVGELNAEVMKMQDPVLKAKLSQSVAQINAQNQEAVRQIRKEKYAQKMDEYKFEVNAHMKRQSVAASRYATSVSRRNAVDRLGLEREKIDEARRARAGAAQAEQRKLQLNPKTSGIRMQDGSPVTARDKKEFETLVERMDSLTDMQTKAEALKSVLSGRIAAPGTKTRARQNAAFSELITAGGMKLSGQMSDKDVALVKNARGGELDKAIRLSSKETVMAIVEDFQAQKAAEGRKLARTRQAPGENWVYTPIIDEKLVDEITGGVKPEPLTLDQHHALITDRNIPGADRAQAIDDFLTAAQSQDGGIYINPDDPRTRDIIEALSDPEVRKHAPKPLVGVEGEGQKVTVGRDRQGELLTIEALGSKRAHSASEKLRVEDEYERRREEMLNMMGGWVGK